MKRFLVAIGLFFICMSGMFACGEIAAPANPGWKSGSTATAAWDAVDSADYYLLSLCIHDQDKLIGTIETGTAYPQVDVQQEVNALIKGGDYASVQLSYTVKAGIYAGDGSISYGPESESSPALEYEFAMVKLVPPAEITLHADGTAEWKAVKGADHYSVWAYITSDGDQYSSNSTQTFVEGPVDETGMFSCNIKNLFDILYREAGLYNGEYATFWIRVESKSYNTTCFIDSELSGNSNEVEYATGQLIQLNPPTEITLHADGTAEWKAVKGADHYSVWAYITSDGDQYATNSTQTFVEGPADESGTFSCDIKNLFDILYRSAGLYNGEYATFWIQVESMSYNTTSYIDSEPSESSNEVEYATGQLIQLSPPTEITLHADGTAEWKAVAGADYYSVWAYITSNGDQYATNSTQTFVEGPVDETGMYSCDIKNLFDILYRSAGLYNGEAALFHIQVCSMSRDTDTYVDSNQSAASNTVEYALRTQVERLTLNPSAPVIYAGNSYYLGKTIEPSDAYYTSINWTSSDPSVVSVDSSGRIHGVKPGSAEITASINSVSHGVTNTVTVTVYHISSNIEDPGENEQVTDTAGSIIDHIANTEKPDLGNTDISADDLDDIQQSVQNGIWRGDAFFTDLVWYEENFSKYKNNWGQIQKAARNLNARFAGAYNIEVEMHHKDQSGTDYHIGNIVEMENEVTFSFDLPTGISEIQSGYSRKYVLVRIHRNAVEAIDVEVENQSFSAQSNCFSDFVLLYVDSPLTNVDLSGYTKLTLPSSLKVIGREAFAGTTAEVVILPETCTQIASRAFADCPNLKYIVVPANADLLAADDAFEGCKAELLYQ